MSVLIFILSIIVLIVGLVMFFVVKHKIAGIGLFAGAVLLCIVSCFAIVPTGYTGILTTFGAVEERTLGNGPNFIAPWQSVVNIDNREQKVSVSTSAFSSDIQQVDLTVAINYSIDAQTARNLYHTVGQNYYDTVMYPRIQEDVKAVFSQYTAENLVANREILSDKVFDLLARDMETYNITIRKVTIENIDFTDAFTNAVEAKQVAQQNRLTAETQQAQATMEEEARAERAVIAANAEAEQAIIAAKADLEVVQIQAEASLYAGQREAEMNQRISEALTPELIQYYWIKQWDGKLPTTVLGENTNYMIAMDD